MAAPRIDLTLKIAPTLTPAQLLRYAYNCISIHQTQHIDNIWVVVDTRTAEPEVNWPGEFVGEYHTSGEADAARWQAVLDIFLSNLMWLEKR